jgi:tRNA-splicing ligase RtcB
MITKNNLIKIHNALFEIPKTFRDDMHVAGRAFVNEEILDDVLNDRSLEQLVNVATLPGIVGYALAMPDIHEGYGFPIGGVAATAINNNGVISPGGIGYDINCGVRLMTADITVDQIRPKLEELATALYKAVPSGVGRGGNITLTDNELDDILMNGAHAMLKNGFGVPQDIDHCEEYGNLKEADSSYVSDKAKNRGRDQLGTLGSGNHFLEVQYVEKIYDAEVARAFNLSEGKVTIMIHCGSRGLGHQTCTDYVRQMIPKLSEWNITLPDKELACAPVQSPEGQAYFKAMRASANFAWANRHLIGHKVRESFTEVFGNAIRVDTVYDVSHNMGKKEKHIVDGTEQELLVHRKGATRAFPAGHPDVVQAYRATGHPVMIPGTMGTSSYVLVGTQKGLTEAFGTSCHGAGRRMSRMQAKRTVHGKTLRQELEDQGIVIRCDSYAGLAEEAPFAYKDVDTVTDVIEYAELARRVVQLKPLAVIKGG